MKDYKRIESIHNPVFRHALSLAEKGPSRLNPQEFILEGEKLILEAAKSGYDLKSLMVIEGAEPLAEKIPGSHQTIYLLSGKLMRRLSSLETPPKLFGIVAPRNPSTLEQTLKEARTAVVLDRVQDPGNLGTIIRSCEALKADTVLLLKGSCSQYNHKVLRASMGSSFRLPIHENLDAEQLLRLLQQYKFVCIGTSADGNPLDSFSFPPKVALFFGSEGQGLSDSLLAACEALLGIPINPRVESLNVAASVAVCLYERTRKNQA